MTDAGTLNATGTTLGSTSTTMSSGSALNANGLTISSGATLKVSNSATVTVLDGQLISVNGQFTLTGATVTTNLAGVVDQQGRPGEALGPIEEAAKIFAELSPKLGKNEEFEGNRAKHKSLQEAIRRHLDAGKPAASPGK